MSESLWDLTAEDLLARASSADPTPGGGAIAAVTAAFGLSLLLMAVDVSMRSSGDADDLAQLAAAQGRGRELQAVVVAAVDRDVADFGALMAGYRMPRQSDDEQASRNHAIEAATVTATCGPLELAEAAVLGIALGDDVEGRVKDTIVSDVQAGRDLLRGAALAALRTADINLAALEAREHTEASALRERQESVIRAVSSADGSQ